MHIIQTYSQLRSYGLNFCGGYLSPLVNWLSIALSGLLLKEYNPQIPLSFSKDANIIDLDAASIRFPLTLRRTEAGDRFTPLGMQGTQLVSDFLTNRKRNRFEKRTQLVLQDATGTILWVVGQRINHHFRLTEETTKCLRVEALL